MRQPYAYVANESTRRLVEDGMRTGLTNTHTARGFSVLHYVIKATYLTLPYVTSLRGSFCLGTFARGFIRLLVGN